MRVTLGIKIIVPCLLHRKTKLPLLSGPTSVQWTQFLVLVTSAHFSLKRPNCFWKIALLYRWPPKIWRIYEKLMKSGLLLMSTMCESSLLTLRIIYTPVWIQVTRSSILNYSTNRYKFTRPSIFNLVVISARYACHMFSDIN